MNRVLALESSAVRSGVIGELRNTIARSMGRAGIMTGFIAMLGYSAG